MPRIYDNIELHLVDGLRDTIKVSGRGDFCVGYFNLRGWKGIADMVDQWDGSDQSCCRLLIGMQQRPEDDVVFAYSNADEPIVDNAEAKRLKEKLALGLREQLTIGIPTEQDETGLRKLAKQIRERKVRVKLYLKHRLHAKLYLCFRDDVASPIIGYVGSSNLTFSGMKGQGELNVDVVEEDTGKKLSEWFNNLWDDRLCIDISEELLAILKTSWAGDTALPYHIYLKIAYHLSQEARAGLLEYDLPLMFRDVLQPFQAEAVKIAAHHLNKRGGVVVGDVVGFGKSFVACALMKLFEETSMIKTLIICPPNLMSMWENYIKRFDLKADVESLGAVQTSMATKQLYKLVLIDESHNLRNREGKRYRAVREYLQFNQSKVILLTATPYNKSYLDMSSQLGLFLDPDLDLGLSPERYIESVGGPIEFKAKHQSEPTTLSAFEKSDYAEDWRELMRLFMVRRTRSFIKQHYARKDESNGRHYLTFADGSRSYFPVRQPLRADYAFNPHDSEDQYASLYSEQVVGLINSLDLPRYGLQKLVYSEEDIPRTDEEQRMIENLSRAGKRLMGFARTNIFKRLESSAWAFIISVYRHILRNYLFLYAIENKLRFPIGPQETLLLDVGLDDESDDPDALEVATYIADDATFMDRAMRLYETFDSDEHRKRFDWVRAELFTDTLKQQLTADITQLKKVLELGRNWMPERDSQLNRLHQLCTIDHPNEKILVFTQFADTAKYLFDQLEKRGLSKLELATGSTGDPTGAAIRFSPKSNMQHIPEESQTRVLISTDVLSEGQNLQDGHIVVNYDLPWALIRLIQRAGRVDRIGQESEMIKCYSFLPEDGIEQIIRLRSRLKTRITENAETVGSDETFFEGDPVNLADIYSERAGILDDETDAEVDLASYAYSIWKAATERDPSLIRTIEGMPDVVYSTKRLVTKEEADPPGVVVYCRTGNENDVLAWVDAKGEVVTQAQMRILEAVRCEPDETALPRLNKHHELVAKGVEHIADFETKLGGQLGSKRSVRYRIYHKLLAHHEKSTTTLFANESLKRVIDDIYGSNLKEGARELFNRDLKAGASDEQLAALAVALREEGKLIVETKDDGRHKPPRIICSMGLKDV